MRKTAFALFGLILASALALVLTLHYGGPKPVFYAKVIAKQAGNLLVQDTVDWLAFGIKIKAETTPYDITRQNVIAEKRRLTSQSTIVAGKKFEEMLLNEILPYWYGTEWDFNGYTASPRKGKVACGYFVSTTLQHLGVNVNRYHLAQQTPENEARTLAGGEEVEKITGNDTAENLSNIENAVGEGISFVGLGRSHVGFLLKRKGGLFFAHSSYLSPGAVTIEKAAWSPVFCAYDEYYIVELSNNEAFIKKWLNNEKLAVIKHQ